MKKITLLSFLNFILLNSYGQNLVPNGDFEQYSNCPSGVSDFNGFVSGWFNPTTATPDYFNQCSAGTLVGVPGNWVGYQYAHSGIAYSAIVIVRKNNNPNFREYLEIQLTTTLTANTCYHFEMYFSLANSSKYVTDDIQVYFSDVPVAGIMNSQYLPFIPNIANAQGNYPDTVNWIIMSGNYTASGNENYLLIGNFKDSLATNTVVFNPGLTAFHGMICIDDVSLSPCTGIEEQNSNSEIKIYPNPVKDELFVNAYGLSGKIEIKVTDVLGKEIYRHQFLPDNYRDGFRLPTSGFQNGIYFIEINDACLPDRQGKNIYRKKFLKESF
jgi:type IX secretion system substrate protein